MAGSTIKAVSVGVWGGICQISTETIMLVEGEDPISETKFCLLTNAPVKSEYNYTAVVGFGKPDGSYESIYDSAIGQYWTEQQLKPQVTFDLQFEGY